MTPAAAMSTPRSRDEPSRASEVHRLTVVPAQRIVGRTPELRLLARFLDQAAGIGGALVLSGDPGVGKSTLLHAASDAAAKAGLEVLPVAGAEFEADLGYSGLHMLLGHLADCFPAFLGPKADSLSVALGLAAGPPPDRALVADAVLALLTSRASSVPVLVVVDDVQWLDRPSAGVLAIVARRLAGTRVGLLAAHRAGEAGFFDRSGLPQHSLTPLDAGSAVALVRASSPGIAATVLRRVVDVAEGNPLALVEVPHALETPQLTGAASLPAFMPLGPRLERLFTARVRALPAATRALLLLTALHASESLEVLRGEAGDELARHLAPAESSGLLTVDRGAGRLTFRHGIVRSTLVSLSTVAERQEAHARLAEKTSDPERHAWHRAAATAGPDEAVAGLLEAVAQKVLDRGDATGAVTALLRAAALTPDARRRGQRLAVAASFSMTMSGELRTAADLLAEIRQTDPGMDGSLTAAVVASLLLINADDGDVPTAHALLARTIDSQGEQLDATDDELIDAFQHLLQLSHMASSPQLWDVLTSLAARLRPAAPPVLALLVQGSHPVRAGKETLMDFDRLVTELGPEPDPVLMTRVTTAAFSIDRVESCCPSLRRFVSSTRTTDGGAVAQALPALMTLSWQGFFAGRWDECEQTADEGLAIATALGFGSALWPLRLGRAAVAAARGDVDTVREVTDDVIGWAAPRQVGSALEHAHFVRSLAAVSVRRFDEAYRECVAVAAPGVVLPQTTRATWFVLDIVEAAIRTGRHDEAAAHARAVLAADLWKVSPRAYMAVATAQALTSADDDEAERHFQRAIRVTGGEQWTFEHARVQLLHGEHLRRRRATTAARLPLTSAHDTFVALRADPWVQRASAELRATGSHLDTARQRTLARLTSQEHEVAELAAAGLSNRVIAERLLISPRTVGMHLYRVFPKLDVSSRAGLRDALDRVRR